MDIGWIKLHRKLEESPIYRDSYSVHLFIHLLLSANRANNTFYHGRKLVEVMRGEHLTGIFVLKDKLGMSINILRARLKVLQDEGMIIVKSTNRYSIISVCNYDKYQARLDEETQTNSKQTANGQQTDSKQINTNKNIKNIKNDIECIDISNTHPCEAQVGQRELTDLYLALIKQQGITYLPSRGEYINFSKRFKDYTSQGATVEELKVLLTRWINDDVGSWCGYRLCNFWNDIGKLQVKKESHADKVLREIIQSKEEVK